MRIITLNLISVILYFFLTLFLFPSQSHAVSVCGGTITCHQIVEQCVHNVTGLACACGSLNCGPPFAICNGTPPRTDSCGSFSQSTCGDSSWHITYCNTGCSQTGALISASCNWQADACTVSSQCGSCGACCAGSPNYCRTDGFTCGGAPIPGCGPTPTPTSPPSCTYGSCSPAGAVMGSSDPTGYYSCDGTCWQWVNCPAGQTFNGSSCSGSGSTPIPTTAPTSPPSSGGGGSSTCPVQCLPSAACYEACTICDGSWPDFSNCGGGSSCMENGGTCNDHITGVSTCCSGYCNYGTCEAVPTCSGCTLWNGSYCQDNNFLCGGGQICSGGVCINPTYTISGKVFVDTNGNGTQDCSWICDNGAGDELNYQGATVQVSPGGSQVTNSSGSYSRSNLISGTYQVSLTLPNGYTATTTNPRSVTVGPDQTVNFGIVQSPADCPSEITASTNTVDSGGTVSLSMSGCTGVEDPPNGTAPPPFDWDPPQDDNPTDEGDPQCSDGVDNDGDGLVDTLDPGCHWDGDTTNPGSYRPNDDNEGNVSGPRQCNDGADNDGDGFVDLADPECNNSSDDNESDRLSPGRSGSTTCSDGELAVINTTSTSSTAVWTAPRCATSQLICTINGTVNGPGGTDSYTENITVRQTGVINVDIRDVSDGSACGASAPLYIGNATLELAGGLTTTETINDGTYSFACLPNSNYTVSLGLPAGYQMIVGGTSQTTSITDGIKSRDIRFCIANFEPWFQTTQGDVRMRGIVNPIPAGFVGSTDASNPSVFFSTQYSAEVDAGGSLSAKNWLVNREYEYNSLTRNRNGIVAYSFYKSRARQEGIPIIELGAGNMSDVNGQMIENGVYEVNGDLVIDSYSQIPERVALLVNGNVTISSEISIPEGQLFILAASGNITVSSNVGHELANFSSTDSNIEGIYSAQGDIVLEGTECAGGVPDRRLNVGGALIANAQKPFASDGGGTVQNGRSLCLNDDNYPSLYVSTRADFLTKLTDFYKVSYTKWREVNP